MKSKNILLASAAIITSALCLNASASLIPEGVYMTASQIAGYNIIYRLEANENGVMVNGKPAVESNEICSELMPGGPCRVNISWVTMRDHKPFHITESVSWTSGVIQLPHQFRIRITNDLGQAAQTLIRAY